MRALEVRPAVVRPLAEVEAQVRNAVRLRRERDTEETIVAELRAHAKTSVHVRW